MPISTRFVSRFSLFASSLLAIPLLAQPFTPVNSEPPTQGSTASRSVNWVDIDGDGRLDLFVSNGLSRGQHNELYRNTGNGPDTLETVVGDPVVSDNGRSDGSSWGDIDNDGDPDLFVANWYNDNNFFYLNNGDGTFTQITDSPLSTSGGLSETGSWGDFDNDGFLDLAVANSGDPNSGGARVNFRYRNNGDGTFTRITGTPDLANRRYTRGITWMDVDGDRDLDLMAFNENNAANELFLNQLSDSGTAVFVRSAGGDMLSDAHSSWSGSWGDYDNDGDPDLFVANWGNQNNALYRNDGYGTFTKIAGEVLVSDGGFSACAVWGDYDNDGDLDLAVSNAYGTGALTNFLYRNELIESGNPTFQKVNGDPFVVDPGYTYGLAWGDYDLDGDLDLFAARTLSENQSNALYRNDRVAGNAWVQVDLEGTTSNRSGIGAIVRVKTLIGGQAHWLRRDLSGQDGYCAQTLRLHFGLGDAPRIDSLIVEWPSGIRDVLENPTLNRVLKITEGSAVGIGNPPQGLFQGFELLPNYPNPFNPGTGFGVRMDKSAGVRIKVYNSLGQQVATIFEGPLGRGLHPFRWDGRNTSGEEVVSGNYILLVLVGGWQRQSRLLTLLR